MSYINFSDLIDTLKKVEGSQVHEEVVHQNGVLRKTVVNINPYTITIEYVDFGKYQSKLKLTAAKPGENPTNFDTVEKLMTALNIKVDGTPLSKVN